jgi:short-subunit dehydrogenase
MKSTKKVIITGTSRGIGYELVKLFSKAGHKVLALSRNSKPISQLNDPNVTSLSFNLNDPSDFVLVNDFIKKEWGNVDILINNAGSLINKPFLETSAEDFKNVFSTNVFGVAELIKCVLPFMSSAPIIFIKFSAILGDMKIELED